MSDTYETEQAGLKERVKTLKSEIAKAKKDDYKILDFMMLIYKYASQEKNEPCQNAAISALFVKFSLEVRQVRLRESLPKIIGNIGILVGTSLTADF